MKTLLIRQDIDLLPKPNEYHLILHSVEPPPELTTSAFILAFKDDRLLMSKLASRGWDIPGGHVDVGEAPRETARRELYEETGAIVDRVQVLGYDKFIIHGTVPKPCRYPHPISYQLFYWARIVILERFRPTMEVLASKLFAPENAQALPWVEANGELYAAALSLTRSNAGTNM